MVFRPSYLYNGDSYTWKDVLSIEMDAYKRGSSQSATLANLALDHDPQYAAMDSHWMTGSVQWTHFPIG